MTTDSIAQLLREAASELRANIEQQYGQSLEYPSYRRKYDAAMELPNSMDASAASLEAQEPVAWMRGFVTYAGVDGRTDGERICSERKVYDDDLPLYRHPPTSAVPDGWKLVPVEPDYNMIKAADEKLTGKSGVLSIADAYQAMLAAAPQQGVSDNE